MATQFKYLTFQKPASATGIQTITGVGFLGKALLIWSDQKSSHGVEARARISIGMTDGVEQVCRSIHHPGNETTGSVSAGSAERTTRLVWHTLATVARNLNLPAEVEGQFVNFTADGFSINWLVNGDGIASIFHVLVLGGDVQVKLKRVKMTMKPGQTIAVTGVGFQPETYIVLGGAADEFGVEPLGYSHGGAHGSICGLGFSDVATNVCGWTMGRNPTSGAPDSNRGQHIDRMTAVRIIDIDGHQESCATRIQSSDPDGFTVFRVAAWDGVPSHKPFQYILCLRGVVAAIGNVPTPATPGEVTYNLGFQAQCAIFQTCSLPSGTTDADSMNMSLGAWQGDFSNQSGVWVGGVDNISPSIYARASYTESAIRAYAPQPGGVSSIKNLDFAVSAVSATHLTINFTTVPPIPVNLLYLALRDSGEVAPLSYSSSRWAKVPIPNPVTHYGGYIEPRLLTAGTFMRALSDRRGRHEISSFQFTLADGDRAMLTRAGGATSQFMDNCTVIARAQSDEDRRAFLPARTLGIGIVREHMPETKLKYSFRADEYLSKYIGSDRNEGQTPKRKFSKDYIPDLPSALKDLPERICYGDLSSKASITPAPVINLQWADGGLYSTNLEGWGVPGWHMGWGTLTSDAAVPSGVVVTVDAGGGINLGDGPLDLYNIAVTAVDNLGVESDPIHFNWHEPNYPYFGQITASGQKITVTWNPSAGAVGYRVYVGYANRDEAFMRLQTFATGVVIDKVPKYGSIPEAATMPAGAQVIEFAQSWVYAVSAVMNDGETYLSAECYGKSQGYRRPLKISWNAVPGALGYRVYRREVRAIEQPKEGEKGTRILMNSKVIGIPGPVWDRKWEVAAGATSFSDDLLDTNAIFVEGTGVVNGAMKLIPCGTETSIVDGSLWLRFFVAAHACYEITGVFVDGEQVSPVHYGASVLVPGQPGYTNYFPNTGTRCQYRDLNGRRYTFIYARGPIADAVAKGEKTGAVNLRGIEAKGDSTGNLVDHIADQYLHWLINFVLGDYQSGDWATVPPFWPDVTPALRVIDVASFDRAKNTIADTRIASGYTGGGVIGDAGFESVEDVVMAFNMSIDGFSYVNARGQFSITLLDDTITTYTSQKKFTQALGIVAGTFSCTPSNEEWENYIPYKYRYNYQKGDYLESTFKDDKVSIARYRETKIADEVNLRFVQDGLIALNIVEHRLVRTAYKPWMISFDTTAQGVDLDLSEFFGFQTAEMIGADPNATHLGWLERIEFDADKFITTVSGRLRSVAHLA